MGDLVALRRNLNQFRKLIGGQRIGDELQVDRFGHHDIQTLDFVGIQQGFGGEQWGASTEVEKRPPNREAEYRVYDPEGNPIDLSQHGWPH